jgi:hypothetical protein
VHITAYLNVTPYSLVEVYHRFGVISCLHHKGALKMIMVSCNGMQCSQIINNVSMDHPVYVFRVLCLCVTLIPCLHEVTTRGWPKMLRLSRNEWWRHVHVNCQDGAGNHKRTVQWEGTREVCCGSFDENR